MATLWLGGSEEDVEHRRMLVGLWQDRAGSTYVVFSGGKTTTLSVLTMRRNGQQRYTKDLIDTSRDIVTWGKDGNPFIGTVSEDRVTWRREGTVFNWIKLQ